MKKNSLTAVGLKRIFIGCMSLSIILLVLSFSWLSDMLRTQVMEADHKKIDADIARSNIDQLRFLETYLDDNKNIVNRAQAIVSEAGQYQQQVVNDINAYAGRSGVTVLGYNFTNSAGAASSKVSGTSVTQVTVTLANPIEYTSFLRFLMAIEQNLTRMQVTGVSLTPDTENPNQITNPQIGLEVYIKGAQ